MLTGSDQIQILPFNLIHHGIHFRKAHNSCHHIAADHKWGHTVGKASANHKIPCIRNNCRMKSCNISHQIIEAISGNLSGAVKVKPLEPFHNFRMIRNLKIRRHRFSILLHFHIFTVVFSNGNGRINNIGNNHHNFCDLFLQLSFQLLQFCQTFCPCIYLGLYCLRFFFLSLAHQRANLLGQLLALSPEGIRLLLGFSGLDIQFHHLIHQWQLAVLKFVSDVLLYCFGIFP